MPCFPIYCAALLYALTGAPSSGKTSIIKELEKKGESVIAEAATDRILSQLHSGISEPWKDECFPLGTLQLQLERKEPWLMREGRVFVDRGVFDVYTFAMGNQLAGTQALADMNQLLKSIDLNQRYKAVFFITPHSVNFSPLQTEVRCEDAHEASKLELATYAIYCRHDHFIVVPGELTPEERADFILEKIREME